MHPLQGKELYTPTDKKLVYAIFISSILEYWQNYYLSPKWIINGTEVSLHLESVFVLKQITVHHHKKTLQHWVLCILFMMFGFYIIVENIFS